MNDIVPVILCGGSGTRLWPRSRAAKPKPFLPLVGDSTLFEASLRRCPADAGFAPPVVITVAKHLEHVEAQLGDAAAGAIIIEPEAKNTAAAIALAACRLPEDAVMLVCPSDHHIGDTGAFFETARAAASLAREGWLVSFGIEANFPETGFGYLKRGEPIGMPGSGVSSRSGSGIFWRNWRCTVRTSPLRFASRWSRDVRIGTASIPSRGPLLKSRPNRSIMR
jgi:mannose-1-phosphate guanylyltransferase/mannose-1-phosphate guanylyltransferase/mannose-6-phosphate isomerase